MIYHILCDFFAEKDFFSDAISFVDTSYITDFNIQDVYNIEEFKLKTHDKKTIYGKHDENSLIHFFDIDNIIAIINDRNNNIQFNIIDDIIVDMIYQFHDSYSRTIFLSNNNVINRIIVNIHSFNKCTITCGDNDDNILTYSIDNIDTVIRSVKLRYINEFTIQ